MKCVKNELHVCFLFLSKTYDLELSAFFNVGPATAKEFIISGVELFCTPCTEVSVMCYQPPCHSCFQFVIIFMSVVTEILRQGWKKTITTRRRINLI
jgi:hypothetical protein